jgi:hypothetical protein
MEFSLHSSERIDSYANFCTVKRNRKEAARIAVKRELKPTAWKRAPTNVA